MGEKQSIKPNGLVVESTVSLSGGFKGGLEFVEDRRPLILSLMSRILLLKKFIKSLLWRVGGMLGSYALWFCVNLATVLNRNL